MGIKKNLRKKAINRIIKELSDRVEALEKCDDNDLVGLFKLTGCSVEEFAKYIVSCPMEEQLAFVEVLEKHPVILEKNSFGGCYIISYLYKWKIEKPEVRERALKIAYEYLLDPDRTYPNKDYNFKKWLRGMLKETGI